MDGPDLGSSRRSNGLRAPAYAPLADIDPRATEVVLAALARAGVGAYAEPAPGAVGGYLGIRLPDRPADRLWADPSRRTVAREIVDRELAALAESLAAESLAAESLAAESLAAESLAAESLAAESAGLADADAAWQQIVAGFDRTSASPVPPWPVSEDAGPSRPVEPSTPRVIPESPVSGRTWLDRDDEHFDPPPPPPVPRPHQHTALAALAIVAGLVLVLWPGLLSELDTTAAVGLGVISIVGGAAALVWRMRDAPPADSDPDDGAVV